MKIAMLAFAGSESTLGMTIVENAIRERFPEASISWATEPAIAKEADYLLVSLYWWKDVFELLRYLAKYGIDPRTRKPTIIIGGMAAVNPRPITGYYHYAVIGDGEVVIGDLLERLESGESPDGMVGVWSAGGCKAAAVDRLTPMHHTDIRSNKTDRVEIARGCKQMCDFCQLAWSKPYRELPFEQVRHLIITAKTKTIALFAPDMWSHTKAADIEAACRKAGKNNSGSDVRLDEIENVVTATRIRFGLEAFGEKTRRRFRKIRTNADLERLFVHMAKNVVTKAGKPITTATMYTIADLPGEGLAELNEFWDVMRRIDAQLTQKFTLFLSVSSFTPSPHTPMWCCPINLDLPFKSWFMSTRPRLKNIVIATRGALRGPAPRLCQMLTIRGDERVSKAMFYLANKAYGIIESAKHDDGPLVEKIIKASGFDPHDLVREYGKDEVPPWACVETFTDAWRTRGWYS